LRFIFLFSRRTDDQVKVDLGDRASKFLDFFVAFLVWLVALFMEVDCTVLSGELLWVLFGLRWWRERGGSWGWGRLRGLLLFGLG
jgi:hypothetical protein